MASVTIILASYNGARFIQDQLDSIIRQTYQHWQLFIRDDGSTDTTVDVIRRYCRQDSRIRLIDDDHKNLGPCGNFEALFSYVQSAADYVMCADQDDVWLPEKVQVTLDRMLEVERIYDTSMPILVHTDMSYVDEALKPLSSQRYIAYKFAGQQDRILHRLVSQNYIWGCTTMINRSLLKCLLPISSYAINHDYWLALVAAAIGRVEFVPKATLLYRQHASNASIGLKSKSMFNRVKRLTVNWHKMVEATQIRVALARDLCQHVEGLAAPRKQLFLRKFIRLAGRGGVSAVFFCMQNGITRQGIIQTSLYYLTLIQNRSPKRRL